jgi:O-glycosyl hydrolase
MSRCVHFVRLACVAACAVAACADAAEPTVVQVRSNRVRQLFQGMGCGAIYYEGHIASLGGRGTPVQEALYNDMFTRVRTNFLELMIRPEQELKPVGDDPYFPTVTTAYSCYEPTLRICAAAKKRNPLIQLYATLYTPPPWMKTNNSDSGGGKARGTLKPGMDLQLGEFCWKYLDYMRRHGNTVSYLSICNEPDWEHTQPGYFLTPRQHAELFAAVGKYLTEMERRFPATPKPRLVAPNVLSAVDCATNYLPATLATASEFLDVVGCHDYDRRGHRWAALRQQAGKRPLWLTEWCVNGADASPGLINSATEFWLVMTEAFNDGVNVWMAYDWVYPPHQGGEALIQVDWGKAYHFTKIYHAYRQWCNALTPGMHVVETELSGPQATGISQPGVKATAFIAKDQRMLVVQVAAVQDQPANLALRIDGGFANARVRCWRTSASEDAVQLPDCRFHDGQLKIALPARGMTTLRVVKEP